MENLNARRGFIYEFKCDLNARTGDKLYALVVSSDSRATDKIISVILLSEAFGTDCVEVRSNFFKDGYLYANCGKVTFTDRINLVKECGQASGKVMKLIDSRITGALGLTPLNAEAENKVYKELYTELLERYLK